MKKGKIKIINHTADIGIEVYGETIKEIFLNSAKGLYEMMGIENNGSENFLEINLQGNQIEELLVKFLNELIYLVETKKLGGEPENIIIEKKENEYLLKALLRVKNIKKRYKEIKAATYHNLKIEKAKKGFKTTIIFDL
ncbi:MAG: archease [Candidatus Omnitrophica bacterium]|nr:archease [Candidatus Omnitrophota bacterium]